MQIKFNDEEKKILTGFLFQTKYGARKKVADLDFLLKQGSITNSQYDRKIEGNKVNIRRIEKLINKFTTPSYSVKLKRRDVRDLTEIMNTVISIHEEVVSAEKPHLTEEDYSTCKSTLEKLEDGMERSTAQDRK